MYSQTKADGEGKMSHVAPIECSITFREAIHAVYNTQKQYCLVMKLQYPIQIVLKNVK